MTPIQASSGASISEHYDAVVVGTGFSGLYMLHILREQGLRVKAYEAGSNVGGVWYYNRYPGLRCDSESVYFNFFFSEEIYKEWTWSSRYPQQPEILEYLNFVADKLDLRKDIQFHTRVEAAHFDEKEQRWVVTAGDGTRVSAQYFITATGTLSVSNVPSIKGLDQFKGECYHTGKWPHTEVDFRGKKVAVIGTGSSGVQVIPIVAEEAAHLTVFQRTPQYTIPARNRPLDPEFVRSVKENFHEIRRKVKYESDTGILWELPTRSALEVTPQERQARFESLWQKGGPEFWWSSFNDLAINPEANATISEFARNKIRETVKDPKVAEKLIPDFPLGAKRPIIDTNYFETYNRDNVLLVDLRSEPIVEITEKGIKTSEAEYELDMIVFATGYDALTGPLFKIDIRGKGGRTLKEKWENGANIRTFLGLGHSGFPNFFTITGPQSIAVHGNIPVIIEQNVEWVADCIKYMRDNRFDLIEAVPEAEEDWARQLQEAASRLFISKFDSWYTGGNIDGKPRGVLTYRGGLKKYRSICDASADKGYEGFKLKKL